MTIKPIDQQITVLNSVQESKNQHHQNNRAHNTNQFIQGQNQNDVEKNKSRITSYDESQGQKVKSDEKKEQNQQHQSGNKKKKKDNPDKEQTNKDNGKGSLLDIKI
ncbi:MAG: hypothetical protein D5S00_09775 [Tindallia sp. MSAO_Bac2]|nr:MAG: hypothetical protein D5S00_09775 [Tindallia sp. MSAO_Bac2]